MTSIAKLCTAAAFLLLSLLSHAAAAAEKAPLTIVAVDVTLPAERLTQAHYATDQMVQVAGEQGQRIAVVAFGEYIESMVSAQLASDSTAPSVDQMFTNLPDSDGSAAVAVGFERAVSEADTALSQLVLFVSEGSLQQLKQQDSNQYRWLSRVLVPEAANKIAGVTLVLPPTVTFVDPALIEMLNELPRFTALSTDDNVSLAVATKMQAALSASSGITVASADRPTDVVSEPLAEAPAEADPPSPPVAVSSAPKPDVVATETPVETVASVSSEVLAENAEALPSQGASSTDASGLSRPSTVLQGSVFLWIGGILVVIGLVMFSVVLIRFMRRRRKTIPRENVPTGKELPDFPEDESEHYLPLDPSATRRFGQAATYAGLGAAASQPAVDHEAVTKVISPEQAQDDMTVIKPR